MAILSDADRAAIWAEIMAEASRVRDVLGVMTKTELRAAVNAADDWAEANAAAYNTALPLPARTILTAKQKARLLLFVIRRRFEVA